MTWRGFQIAGAFKDLSHLNPFQLQIDLSAQKVNLYFTFGGHCFSDEKQTGPKLPFKGEQRYWSETRYQASLNLPNLIKCNFLHSYAIPFRSRKGEKYYYTEAFDYVIFFEIRKPIAHSNRLNIKIISAYEKDRWGTLPRGAAKRISWILSRRHKRQSIL